MLEINIVVCIMFLSLTIGVGDGALTGNTA